MTYRLISCVIIGMLNCHAHVSKVFVLLLVQHLHIVIIFVSSTKTPKFSLSFWWKVWNFCCHHFENDFIFINTVNYLFFIVVDEKCTHVCSWCRFSRKNSLNSKRWLWYIAEFISDKQQCSVVYGNQPCWNIHCCEYTSHLALSV